MHQFALCILNFFGFVWIMRDAKKLHVNNQIRESGYLHFIFPIEIVLCGLCVWNYATERCVNEENGNVVEKG